MSPLKGTRPQNHVVAREHPPRNQSGNETVPFLNCSKNRPTVFQNSEQQVTTTITGDTTIPLLTTTTPLIEEGLMRDEKTNEVHLLVTYTVVLKRKQEMLYVPLHFEKNLTIDAFSDWEAFDSAIAQNDLDTIKEKAQNNFLNSDDPPNFQIQVANGQLEKPLATTTLKFEIVDNILVEHFVRIEEINRANVWVEFYEA